MPVTWSVKALASPETALPDVFLVTGLIFREDPRKGEPPAEETPDAGAGRPYLGPVLRDLDEPRLFAPIVDRKLVRAIESEDWPFREGARFFLRCEIRRALESVEIDEVEELAAHFPQKDPEAWISLSWPP
ncbi:MAG: hypothetical protein AAF488_05345 [Planctomycetota bacterium]